MNAYLEQRRQARLVRARRIAEFHLAGLSDREIAAAMDLNIKHVREALDMPARELRGAS